MPSIVPPLPIFPVCRICLVLHPPVPLFLTSAFLFSLSVRRHPYLQRGELTDAVRLLYKGTLRVLLVLLHDFPEFLCDNHFVLCEVIPSTCIQLRNLVLSAFPKAMRLPDPFTPNPKVRARV